MGIKENESLYEMTMQGKKWWGDLVVVTNQME